MINYVSKLINIDILTISNEEHRFGIKYDLHSNQVDILVVTKLVVAIM